MTAPVEHAQRPTGDPLDARAIAALLPHRYPFLLVDRIVEIGEDKLVALKNVSMNEPHFQGHFPGHPVMPGVLIVEALAQAGAVMAMQALRRAGTDPANKVVYFMGIDKVRFRRTVVPGDQLRLEVTPLRKGSSVWKLKGEAYVGSELACEGEFLASLADR